MRIHFSPPASRRSGKALLMVLTLAGASVVVLAGVMFRSRSGTDLSARHNQYSRSTIAAEAATEKVIAALGTDYQNYGVPLVNANLDRYRSMIPTGSEHHSWTNYQFMNEEGTVGSTTVEFLPLSTNSNLSLKYQGLRGYAYDVRIVSQVRENGRFNVVARNEQDLELAMVPVFQYAIFYALDLEVSPGPAMTISGPVHCNANIYCAPYNTLDFLGQVTAAGRINMNRKPSDSHTTGSGTTRFLGGKKEKVQTLNLPIGTNNNPAAVHQIIEVPPWNESRSSLLGQLRYYNLADMIITVSNSGTWVRSGAFNNFATPIPWSQASLFVKTNASFYDDRENKTVTSTDIDIEQLRRWSASNDVLRPLLAEKEVRTIYVANFRPNTGSAMPGVRLYNGTNLPVKGLTVATMNPLYIRGHYNVTTNGTPANLGVNNTSQARPASVACDAITILSTAWDDSKSSDSMSSRNAKDTTVNTAVLAGHSPTAGGNYGGGVHNMTRFLEDWTGDTFTTTTAVVSMYPAMSVSGLWSLSYYQPPTREWAYDTNFDDPTKLPPATPAIRILIRGPWSD